MIGLLTHRQDGVILLTAIFSFTALRGCRWPETRRADHYAWSPATVIWLQAS